MSSGQLSGSIIPLRSSKGEDLTQSVRAVWFPEADIEVFLSPFSEAIVTSEGSHRARWQQQGTARYVPVSSHSDHAEA